MRRSCVPSKGEAGRTSLRSAPRSGCTRLPGLWRYGAIRHAQIASDLELDGAAEGAARRPEPSRYCARARRACQAARSVFDLRSPGGFPNLQCLFPLESGNGYGSLWGGHRRRPRAGSAILARATIVAPAAYGGPLAARCTDGAKAVSRSEGNGGSAARGAPGRRRACCPRIYRQAHNRCGFQS